MQVKPTTILLTGAAGFIGSCTLKFLNDTGYTDVVIADDFSRADKTANWSAKEFSQKIERDELINDLQNGRFQLAAIIHLGARTDTTEFDYSVHEKLNVEYSKALWNYATGHRIPFIYASSAATYGDGSYGYEDDHKCPFYLQPLNPYGVSKNEFDKWALEQTETPPSWAGLKFFNVYGPNEGHKGRMASVIWHSYLQIKEKGEVKLFKSHKEGIADGEQLRDFVYVKDVVQVIGWLLKEMTQGTWRAENNGLYNLGTGKARSFYNLAASTFRAMNLEPNIVFIPMPEDIREKYQYFTEASMGKLRSAGYEKPFFSLEDGIGDYVKGYLLAGKLY